MKIKTITVFLILSLVIITQAHSFGLGVQANFRTVDSFETGMALLFSPSEIINIAGNWFIAPDGERNSLGFTLDICPFPLPSAEPRILCFTLGVGFFGWAVMFKNDKGESDSEFDGGFRIPLGVKFYPVQNFIEIFAHIAPSFEVSFTPQFTVDRETFFLPIAVGVRVWFGKKDNR